MKLIRKAGVVLALAVMAFGATGCSYNTFVSQEEAIKAQWAQVENQLQRRNDLIPNLVESVKGVTQQEQEVFGRIADSRAKLAGATTPEQRMQAANEQRTETLFQNKHNVELVWHVGIDDFPRNIETVNWLAEGRIWSA